jgi:KDO2-lipid IV(A) lauroyltransferase
MFNLESVFYNAAEIFFRFIGLVPRKSAIRISGFLGKVLFLVDSKHRKIALDNLMYAFGHQKSTYEIRFLAKQVFINLVQVVFEVGWSLRLDERRLVKYFKMDGFRHLKKAYEKGKGVLVLTAHCGNWEFLAVAGSMIEYPVSMVVRPLDFKPLDRFFINLRSRFGGKIIPKQRSLRAILRSLDRKEMVVLLMDQNVDWYEGVFVDFMGHRACTSKGLALLALRTGAPVVPVFMVREKSGFRAEFGPEIFTVETGDKQKDIEINTQEYNRVIENFIRRYPDQWFWVHQRWKTKPYQAWPRKTDR